jgi:predicted ATPase/DNA-binding SARP family transcriptional activator
MIDHGRPETRPMTNVGDLGPVHVDGTPLDAIVRSAAQRAVFVALVVTQSQGGISGDRLFEFVWPRQPPKPRRLWDAVHRLRAALASHNIELAVLNTAGRYHFDRSITLDSELFAALVDEASSAADHHPRRANELLERAVGLWRGDVCDGHDLELLTPGTVAALHAEHLNAERLRVRAALAVEGPQALVGDLEALTSDHPYDEELAELLVIALRDSGRRVDALRQLRRFTSRLVETLDVEPNARLSALSDELLVGGLTADELGKGGSPSSVPTWPTSFVGRQAQLDELTHLIASHRLITIIGTGGVGKTRLAAELARSPNLGFEAAFVDLTATFDPSAIDVVVSTALGLDDSTSRAGLRQFLDRGDRLVVLDNCEHLVDATALLLADLLGGTTRARFVATSRVPLRSASETPVRLKPLDILPSAEGSEAALLFCQRAQLARSDLPSEERRLVDEIVEQLDGVPLAIELAAARAESLDLDEVSAGLDDRFELLTSGNRSGHHRHRSLEAAVGWSTNLLDEQSKTILARSSIFAGPFTLADAAAVVRDDATGDGAIRRVVADLVDAGLIERERRRPPYRLLATMRQYGRTRLAEAGDLDHIRTRHADHFVQQATSLAAVSFGPGEAAIVDELLSQANDYRAAIETLRSRRDWEAMANLIWGLTTVAFSCRGTWVEPVLLAANVVDERPEPSPPRWAALLAVVASTLHRRGLDDAATELATTAIEIGPDSHLPWLHAGVAMTPSDQATALAYVEHALEISDPDRPEELLHSLWGVTNVRRRIGDRDGARNAAERLIAEASRFETERGAAIGLTQIAYLASDGSAEGRDSAEQAVALGLVSRTVVAEKIGSMLHVHHLLHCEPEAAGPPLLAYLQRPVVHTPFGPSILAAAAAYFAVIGETALALDLGRAVGHNRLIEFRSLPAVSNVLEQTPEHVDPMGIDPLALEAMTTRSLETLHAKL